MKILEKMTVSNETEVNSPPEKIFDFITNLVDDESYRKWHPEDHVSMKWVKGEPWKEGSIVHAVEKFEGKPHKLKFLVTRVIPNNLIEFVPLNRLMRIYYPGNALEIEKMNDHSLFIGKLTVKVGKIVKTFAKNKLASQIESARKHLKEEGENLKKIVEA